MKYSTPHSRFLPPLAALLLSTSALAGGDATTLRVSVSSSEAQGIGPSGTGIGDTTAITPDGRFVAFVAIASNLVPGDTNGVGDVFVRDRLLGTTERVSVSTAGVQGNAKSTHPSLSEDGRYIAFSSLADNLVAGDTNGAEDIFVHDRQTGVTQRVNMSNTGAQADLPSQSPTISASGDAVVFWSAAGNLDPADLNSTGDVFVHDLTFNFTRLVSRGNSGQSGNDNSFDPAFSRTGRYVVYVSRATNFGFGFNTVDDVFVYDRTTNQTSIVQPHTGPQWNGDAREPSISEDGVWVAFRSSADNVVPGDTNGLDDVFVYNRVTRTAYLASKVDGGTANDASYEPEISSDATVVVFESDASNLIAPDPNGWVDVFMYHIGSDSVERVSRRAAGGQGNSLSFKPKVTPEGRLVVFGSQSTNLVPGDNNDQSDVFIRDTGFTPGPVGDFYCGSNPNSTGSTASLTATGSYSVLDKCLLLRTQSLPLNKFGYYLMADTPGFVPLFGGSQGNLCLGSPLIRFNAFVLNSGASGEMDLEVDFDDLPQGASFNPGDRWNFQLWYRDNNPGTTSNTSNAIVVSFVL